MQKPVLTCCRVSRSEMKNFAPSKRQSTESTTFVPGAVGPFSGQMERGSLPNSNETIF